MLAEVIATAEDEITRPAARPALVVVASAELKPDPLRYARKQMQRSILTYSLFGRTLSCGGDLFSYEKVMREFMWTPNPGGR